MWKISKTITKSCNIYFGNTWKCKSEYRLVLSRSWGLHSGAVASAHTQQWKGLGWNPSWNSSVLSLHVLPMHGFSAGTIIHLSMLNGNSCGRFEKQALRWIFLGKHIQNSLIDWCSKNSCCSASSSEDALKFFISICPSGRIFPKKKNTGDELIYCFFMFFKVTLQIWALGDIGFPMDFQVICGCINHSGTTISQAVPQKVTNVWTYNTLTTSQNLLTLLRSISLRK